LPPEPNKRSPESLVAARLQLARDEAGGLLDESGAEV
jgi:hypothetical protein